MKTKSLPGPRGLRVFVESAAALLMAMAAGQIIANWDSAGLTTPRDPVLLLSMRTLFWISAALEGSVALICLLARSIAVKLAALTWLSLLSLLYGLALSSNGAVRDFSLYFDRLALAFGTTPGLACALCVIAAGYLLLGSMAGWVWLFWRCFSGRFNSTPSGLPP